MGMGKKECHERIEDSGAIGLSLTWDLVSAKSLQGPERCLLL
jgi:hypothetical protein